MTPLMISDAETLFTSQMNSAYPTMELLFDGAPVPNTQDIYAAMYVIPGESFPINLGITAKSRNVGEVMIKIVGPKDKGAGATGNIAQYAGRIFRRKVRTIVPEGQVTYKDPALKSMGEMNGKQVYVATIPYRYDYVG